MTSSNHIRLTWPGVGEFMEQNVLPTLRGMTNNPWYDPQSPRIYGIPRGGAICAGILHQHGWMVVDSPDEANVLVDDIVDSGSTRKQYLRNFPGCVFLPLVDKPRQGLLGTWIEFPWETDRETDMTDHVRRLIQAIGDDPSREGLRDTPERVVRSWNELYSGYTIKDPKSILKWFDSDADEMVIMRGIDFWSTCEHHMIPFWGTIDIAYIPRGKVIGISKLTRIAEVVTRRLQIQENLTTQLGRILLEDNHVQDVAVSVTASHACMMARGVKQPNTMLTTNFLHGKFETDPSTRSEFLRR